jgi:hypothetical protein
MRERLLRSPSCIASVLSILSVTVLALPALIGGCGDPFAVNYDGGADLDLTPEDVHVVEAGPDVAVDGMPSGCTGTAAPDQVHTEVTANQTWGPGHHLVQGKVVVPAGITLTVATCAELRFAPASQLEVQGRMLGMGQEGFILRMVPSSDTSQPDLVTWSGLSVTGQGHVELYSTDVIGAEVAINVDESAEVLLNNVRIMSPRRMGLVLAGRMLPGSTALTISGAGDVPVVAAADSVAALPDGTYVGNASDLIEVMGGTSVTTTAAWRQLGVPYRITDMTIDVATGGTAPDLRVAAGVQVQLTGELLVAGGRLSLLGDDTSPTKLTNPEPDPMQAKRATVQVQAPALGLTLQNARLDGVAVIMGDGQLDVQHVVSRSSCGPAFTITDPASISSDSIDLTIGETTPCDIDGTHLPGTPMLVDVSQVSSLPQGRYQGNDQDVILVRGGTVSANGTWQTPVPVRLLGPVFVEGPDSPVLTVARGLRIEAGSPQVGLYVGLRAAGTLIVDGDPDLVQPTRFTSPNLVPGPGDWVGLVFGPMAGVQSHLDGVEVSYAGAQDLRRTSCTMAGDGPRAAVTLFNSIHPPSITRSQLSDSGGFGIALDVDPIVSVPNYADPAVGNIFERNLGADVSPPRDCP